jgi:transcriptional antiterminator NusG
MRETNGVGDFAGSGGGRPMPASPEDVEKLLRFRDDGKTEKPRLAIPFSIGDKVKIVSGSFAETEGEVAEVDANAGTATVNVKLFGKDTPVKLEYWQVEKKE